ncbi:restriction endonuclease subunit S [Shewanella algae]|uniref:restriction endonuclease subunit S n=1 Tax=Shewanella algae TaxID=38313 RepID=UPI001AAFF188|nr:restriction endonuclease subunit S [Shewanella algae]MBO2585026.1 restriction endonuclease subunit S [Shewanella algae]
MSVDKLRGSYHVNRVSPNEIGLLLSAQSYRPAVTKAINKIKEGEWRTLQSLISNVISPGPHPKYDGDYPCLKTKNVQDLIAETSPADWADISEISDLSKVQVGKGDLLINLTGAGSIGRVSVYYGDDLPITNQHIAKMSPNNLIDEGYLVAYLRSFYAERALEQGVAGSTGQINMVNDHVRCTPVRICHSSAQKYIGEKVRQAERLRAWAKELINSSDATISSQFEYSLAPSMRTQPRRVSSALLSPISLGPEFARASEGQATFSDSMKFGDFIDICKCGDPIKSEDRVDGKYSYYGASGPIDKHNEYNFDGEYLIVAQDGSIGCANIARGKFWANNHVWVVKLKAAYDIDSVCRYLDEHFPYWKGITTGSVVPKVTAENLLNLQIPTAIAENEHVGDLLRLSSRATSLSSILVNTAKLLVEDLIEGQLTESQLVSAQQALEAGDDSLDRALIERMTTKGIEADSDPLFDDIDQLYDLLEQAKQALDAEDTMAEA